MVRIGNARISENNSIVGAKGDQTGCEVMEQNWYGGAKAIFRPKSIEDAKKIAEAMRQACANNNIGYNQHDRTSLYQLLVANGWKMNKVGKCNTDCSALVSCCVNYAFEKNYGNKQAKVSKDMYTGNEESVLMSTGKFRKYTGHDYTNASTKLATGDIILYNGHTAVVTEGAITRKPNPYRVDVVANVVVRAKPRKLSKRKGLIANGKSVTITEKSANGRWGKLQSGLGWIALCYTKKK